MQAFFEVELFFSNFKKYSDIPYHQEIWNACERTGC